MMEHLEVTPANSRATNVIPLRSFSVAPEHELNEAFMLRPAEVLRISDYVEHWPKLPRRYSKARAPNPLREFRYDKLREKRTSKLYRMMPEGPWHADNRRVKRAIRTWAIVLHDESLWNYAKRMAQS